MKKLSFMAVLALSTALTACGGGSSGGGYVPSSTLPDNSDTSITDSTPTWDSGTSIQSVNNTQKRSEVYTAAAEAIGVTDEATATSINEAFATMNKILVQQDFSNATEEDILLALALLGEDISGLKDKTLEELKAEAQDTAIKAAAEDVYAKLGTERALSLKDITLYEKIGGGVLDKYTFVIDENGNLIGFNQSDTAGAKNLTLDLVGNGIYKKETQFLEYGFKCKANEGTYTFDVVFDDTPTPEELKEAFKKTAQEQWKGSGNMAALLEALDKLDYTNIMSSEDECRNSIDNCVYKEFEANSATVQYNSVGKNIGLKYADFGTLDWTVESEKETSLFYGGYEALSASAKDLPQVDTEMNFEGKAVAAVTNEHPDRDDMTKMYDGTANLTFKNGNETLVADFTDWHKVTIETDTSKQSGYAFTFAGTPTDTNFAVVPNEYAQQAVDIKYYGENPKNPDEFAGSATYEYGTGEGCLEAEMVFGGVRK